MTPVERRSPSFEEAPAAEVGVRARPRLPILNLVLFALTLATTTIAGALNADVPISELRARWTSGLPFSLTLMAILVAHEMGHYVLARLHGVPVTLPFFLPGPPFLTGTFGAFIRMKSLPRSRRVLFDVGAAGPWAGVCAAIPAVIGGLRLSEIRPIPPSFSGF